MPHVSKRSTQTDIDIGNAIRTVRTVAGLSQTDLGNALGVTFQQIQKYEKGVNRLSVTALIRICKVLNVSPMDLIGAEFGQKSEAVDLTTQIIELKRRLSDIAWIASKG